MNKLFLGAAAAAALLTAGASAQAAVIGVAAGAPTTFAADYAANVGDIVIDFDFPDAPGYSFTFVPGSVPAVGDGLAGPPEYITPAEDPTVYAAVRGWLPGDGGAASAGIFESTGGPLQYVSFFLGSPDEFNNVEFYSGDTKVAEKSNFGGAFSGGLYNMGDIGLRVTFSFAAADNITKLKFTSKVDAMEMDNFTAKVVAVPEPATWAMMLMGFFGLGSVLRSRRQRQALAA